MIGAAALSYAVSRTLYVREGQVQEEYPRDLVVEEVATNLLIPWSITFISSEEAVFTERPGEVKLIDFSTGRVSKLASLEVAAIGEGGLLGVDKRSSRVAGLRLYFYHTYRKGNALFNRVVMFEDEALKEPVVVIDGIPGAAIHNGGRIRFGPDDKLYITTGDAATPEISQRLGSLGGKILRVNPDGSVPLDNPFAGSPVYSYGNRNPQGIDWHPSSKRLYSTEHGPTGELGQFGHDELNLIIAGKNYGWPHVIGEGRREAFVDPIYQSGEDTWAPSGCSFYSGKAFRPWGGDLFFAALRGQHLHRVVLTEDGSGVAHAERLLSGRYGRLRDVVEGPDASLYLLTSNRDGRGSPRRGDDKILRITWRN